MAIMQPAWVCTRFSAYMLGLLAWYVGGTTHRGHRGVFDFYLLLELFSSYWGASLGLYMRVCA